MIEKKTLYCKQEGGPGLGGVWRCKEIAGSGAAVLVTPTGRSNAGGGPISTYAPTTAFRHQGRRCSPANRFTTNGGPARE